MFTPPTTFVLARSAFVAASFTAFFSVLIFWLYIRQNDRKLLRLPPEALAFSPERFTVASVREAAERLATNPKSVKDRLPPKTGRRYIIIGGAGFLGGWIVVHLLERGEDPQKIRVLDIRAPARSDLKDAAARGVDFKQVDISDSNTVHSAFQAPWPDSKSGEISVFHTAANIRFFERHEFNVGHSTKVNVQGTRNVVDAARSIGASTLVYTSSGSISVRRSRFWLWPAQKEPDYFVQVINDDDNLIPKRHEQFFSNYAVTKREAERLVREADKTRSGADAVELRTGCIRPGNGIYGPGGDMLCGAYLVRQVNPTWIASVLQNFIYVENCSLAHLCYEQRLIEVAQGAGNPDIGGQAFCIADAGPPITYGDAYLALSTLGGAVFPILSPTAMLAIAHLIECYYVFRQLLQGATSSLARSVGHCLPAINGDLVNLQPSLYALTMVHLIFDDRRARLPPSEGGLGYEDVWTTLEGLCKLCEEHRKAGGKAEERSMSSGGIGFGLMKAQHGVKRINEGIGANVTRAIEVNAAKALN